MQTCIFTPGHTIQGNYQTKTMWLFTPQMLPERKVRLQWRRKDRKGSVTRLSKKIKKIPKRESWFVAWSRDNLNIISLYFRAPVPSCVDKATGVAMQNLGFKTAGSPDGALNACDDARGVPPPRPLTVKDRDTTHTTAKRTAVTTPLTQWSLKR